MIENYQKKPEASKKPEKMLGILAPKEPAKVGVPAEEKRQDASQPVGVVTPAAATPIDAKSVKTSAKDERKILKKSEIAGNATMIQKKSGLKKVLDGLGNIGLGRERAHFVENIAILLNSGLTVVDALRTIALEVRVKPMKKIVSRIIDDVENGIPLWMSMDNQNFFSSYALALIRIGEESGSLSKNMEYLAIQQEKDRSLRSKVKMAMIYPSIVITITVIVTLGLAWFVLPQLVGVLLSLNAKLPLSTRIIIVIANFFKAHGIVAVPLTGAAFFFLFLICRFTGLRGPVQQCIFRIPGVGTMAKSATIARFGVILGSLLRAGVPLVESIKSMAEVTDTVYYRRFYYKLASEIEVGQSFAAAFASIKDTKKLLPASVQQLIVTGEKSGRIADMLMRVAEIYERKAEDAAQRLPVVLEPMLLIFIGGLVGTIAFSIIVPIYSIVGNVGR